MVDCIFCKIIAGEIPASKVYEDEYLIAIKDIQPAAPIHLLLMPKVHVENLAELASHPEAGNILQALPQAVKQLAAEFGVADKGYRLITNTGDDGGQTVKHLHFHFLAGEKLNEKLV